MKPVRIVRHWLTTRWRVDRAFNRADLSAIEDAVQTCNAEQAGEVCFVIEGALDSAALFRDQSPAERAIEVFSQLRLWDTEHNNGVLIYVLLADRAVEIVADRGVHARVGADEWQAICHAMEAEFRRGAYRDGAIHGIRAVAQHLAKHYPGNAAGLDELPDVHVMP